MIRVLEDRLVNKIAAGEVVERPASVLKELVENSLDAGATSLRLELREGGKSLVRVGDNGHGMDRADATLCLERHATSKISCDEDLFKIHTLGFRGEAIPSIASVSRFELVTRRAVEEAGTRVVVEGGRLERVEDCGAPVGTDISVRQLFFNIPARRKFMRSEATELSHCVEAVLRQVLIRPGVDVELLHDGHMRLRAPPARDRAARAAQLLGEHGEGLLDLQLQWGQMSVSALCSPVGQHRGDGSSSVYLYVNQRFVRDPVLRKAVAQAYQELLPRDRHPTVVLELTMPPEEVDVNVHPAKTELRFRDANGLIRAISEGLRQGLDRGGSARGPAPGPAPRPAPTLEPERQAPLIPPPPPRWMCAEPGMEWGQGRRLRLPPAEPAPLRLPPRPAPAAPEPPPAPASMAPVVVPAPRPELPPAPPYPPGPPPPLAEEPAPPAGRARFAALRVIGQLQRRFALCEGQGELWCLELAAAQERVLASRLRRAWREGRPWCWRPARPALVEPHPTRFAALAAAAETLVAFGVEIEAFGGQTLAIKALPEPLAGAELPRLVDELADLCLAGPLAPEALIGLLARHGLPRREAPLSAYELQQLLMALDEVEAGASGRPLLCRIGAEELERRLVRP